MKNKTPEKTSNQKSLYNILKKHKSYEKIEPVSKTRNNSGHYHYS